MTRRLAAAMTGRAVPVEAAGKVTRGATMRDGTVRPIEVRASITEAELIQAIGRGRGINRTAANPLDVWVMANVVLPLPLDSLTTWQDAAPGPVERMAARGVVLTSPSHAARAYPDVFPKGEKSARETLRRQARDAGGGQADLGPKTLWGVFIRVWVLNSRRAFTYRPPGRGQQFRRGWAPADMDPEDVLAWLVVKLGEVGIFTPEEVPMPAAAPVSLEETAKPPEPAPRQPAQPEDPGPPPKRPAILPDDPGPAEPHPPAPRQPAIQPDPPPPAGRPDNPGPPVPGWWGAAPPDDPEPPILPPFVPPWLKVPEFQPEELEPPKLWPRKPWREELDPPEAYPIGPDGLPVQPPDPEYIPDPFPPDPEPPPTHPPGPPAEAQEAPAPAAALPYRKSRRGLRSLRLRRPRAGCAWSPCPRASMPPARRGLVPAPASPA